MLENSKFINELSQLKESSKDAIISGEEKLNDFREYLHTKRAIEDDLYNILNKEGVGKLVILNGNVGDGKSHLISYMNKKYPEMMNRYKIHNDSTESFDPSKDSIHTLIEVLKNFSDRNIQNNSSNLILCINLGVLFRLVENQEFEIEFKIIKNFIEESKILDASEEVTFYEKNNMDLLSFSDYRIYELTEKGPVSKFLNELFEKIVLEDKRNVFYNSFQEDWNNGIKLIPHLNYKLFQNEKIRAKIIALIIEAILKDKLIISTRMLLNFIYDIIVGTENDYIFNNLFDSQDKSIILNCLKKLAPVNAKNKFLDEIIIDFYNSENKKSFIEKLSDSEFKWFFEESDFKIDSNEKIEKNHMELLRIIYFFNQEKSEFFFDRYYIEYMENLYIMNFETGLKKMKNHKKLATDLMNSYFQWKNDSFFSKEKFIITGNIGMNYKIAQYLKYEIDKTIYTTKREKANNFKEEIELKFKNEDSLKNIVIDFEIYCLMKNILSGYIPNSYDLESNLIYIEFFNKITSEWIDITREIYYNIETKKILELEEISYGEEFVECFLKRE